MRPLTCYLLSILLAAAFWTPTLNAHAQLLVGAKDLFTKADSLRGQLTPLRTNYDIHYYHLTVKVDPDERFIEGNNVFKFSAVEDFNELQFDLFDNLKIEKVVYKGKSIPFTREHHAVFITFPSIIKKGEHDAFTVYYSGHPIQAKRAPWDGGFDFKKDKNGNHWIATACQGLGASVWWPNKDHLSDEVDSLLLSVQVPKGLINVSNGRLRKTEDLANGYTQFDWFVSNPINNYNVALNIGDYVHKHSEYQGEKGALDLDYWVLRENEEIAFKHLDLNVKNTLDAFEHWFGPYPFYEDGYKIVETAHLGMEHQSAIAYGNKYQNGYLGRDGSGSGWGEKWDFIVVHESGHEWFGNNITASDLADMWIHEAFTNYSEALFIEYHYGKFAAQQYLHGNRRSIQNRTPLLGTYEVNKEGSGDMYNKGGVLLHMIRTLIDDDEKWRAILRGLNEKFFHANVHYDDIVHYMSQEAKMDLKPIFEQYVKHPSLPILEFFFDTEGNGSVRWLSDVPNFNMPIRISLQNGETHWLPVSTRSSQVQIPNFKPDQFKVDTFNFYIGILTNSLIN
jgi:aminopeptidase N